MSHRSIIVYVDRSVRPSYPEWVKEPLYPEHECSGPENFDPGTLNQYLFGKQLSGGYETGHAIHEHLLSDGLLASCVNLQDLVAIKSLGIKLFRKHFKGKALFAWKSVVSDHDGGLRVPCLVGYARYAMLGCYLLETGWNEYRPALRLAD